MFGSDMMTVEFIDASTYNLYYLFSTNEVQPSNDITFGGNYDFTNEIFSYYNNTYTITFDRLLDTQDAFDFIITKVILI